MITLIKYLKKYVNQCKPAFIFTPTIDICESIYFVIGKIIHNGNYVHSKKADRGDVIEKFKKGQYSYLVTTAVLERGVTVKNLQVIIYQADHKLYNEHALVQIAGRVGRKIDATDGDVIFLVDKETEEIKKCIKTITTKNKDLQSLF